MEEIANERIIQFDVSPTFARVLNMSVLCSPQKGGCGKKMTVSDVMGKKGKYKLCGDCRYKIRREKIQNKTLEQHIASSVSAANRRSRIRGCSNDQLLTVEEAMDKWTGRCSSCEKELSWTPGTKDEPNYDLASIDRVITTDREEHVQDKPPRYNLRRKRKRDNAVPPKTTTYKPRGYKNNMSWNCWRCNNDKGARDYVEQLAQRIHMLENIIKEKDRIIAELASHQKGK